MMLTLEIRSDKITLQYAQSLHATDKYLPSCTSVIPCLARLLLQQGDKEAQRPTGPHGAALNKPLVDLVKA